MNENGSMGKLHIKIIKTVIIVLTSFIMLASLFSVALGYKAQRGAKVFLEDSQRVTVSDKTRDIFFDGDGTDVLLILYGGALVEERAYSELAYRLAESGIDTVIVKSPFELPILNYNAADSVRKRYLYDHYYVGGHSLGGAFASVNAADVKNIDAYEGIVFLAAYPAANLSNMDLKVLSVYGTNDQVLNMDNYNNSKKYMPKEFTEYVIDGGNHASFGDYGEQRGDGSAEITGFLQRDITIKQIKKFITNE